MSAAMDLVPSVAMSSRVDRLAFGPTTVDFWTLADAAHAIAGGSLRGGIHLCNAYTLALAEERPDVAASLALVRSLGFSQVGEQIDEIDGLELVFERALPLEPGH